VKKYHYIDEQGKIHDPLPLAALKAINLPATAKVLPEGGKEWVTLGELDTEKPTVPPVAPTPNVPSSPQLSPSEKFWGTLFLATFLGAFGAHRFYNKLNKTAIVMLLTFGGLGLWVFIDWFIIMSGNFKDGDGVVLRNPKPKLTWSACVIFFVILLVLPAPGGSGGYETVNGVTQNKSSSDETIHVRYVIATPRAMPAAKAILRLQYSMAKRHPNAKAIVVHTYVDQGTLGLSDQYGNKSTGLLEIEKFSADAEDARRYANASAYEDNGSEPIIFADIVSVRRSWFLDSGQSPW